MKTMGITEFKAHALEVISEMIDTKEQVIVTKRGIPVVEILPYNRSRDSMGKLADVLVYEGDIVSPVAENEWEACR
jgi:prevent-host-death family protein